MTTTSKDSPQPDGGGMRRSRAALVALGFGLAVAIVGALLTFDGLGRLDRAQDDQARARQAFADVEFAVQARRDEAMGQPTLARAEAEDLDEKLDALAALRPEARPDIEVLRTREAELADATTAESQTDVDLVSGVISSLDQVQSSAVRPWAAAIDAAETRTRRIVVATAVLSAAAWLSALATSVQDRGRRHEP